MSIFSPKILKETSGLEVKLYSLTVLNTKWDVKHRETKKNKYSPPL